jgi:hypothetical protein
MYCPSCRTEITPGLNFCNRCGATLGAAHLSRLGALVWMIPLAIAVITLGGLGMVSFIGFELVRRSAGVSTVTALLLLTDVLVVALIDWMLLRQLTRVIDACRPPRAFTSGNEDMRVSVFKQATAREPSEFLPEQTTRSLEASSKRPN